MRCHVLELTAPSGGGSASGSDASGRNVAVAGAAETAECGTPRAREGCYGLRPQDLHTVYGLPQTPVSTQTIAIVAAGGDPTIRKDLANYDTEFGLPGCPGEGSCPTVFNGEGKRHPPAVEGNAPLETSLDVEVAHAVCPGCNLLLVEASSESLPAFEEATDTAARLGADEISISWGGAEPEQVVDGGAAFDHPDVVITAAAGDTGYLNWASPEAERGRPEYPAASPDVIAVGGTDLELGPAGERQGEQVWDQLEPKDEASGSGCSTLFSAPSWQLELPDWEAVGCGGERAIADVSAIAGARLGVAAYDTTKNTEGRRPGWQRLGGTSVGAPLIAAAFALAGGSHGVAYPAQTVYRNAALDPGLLYDITTGTNGACRRFLGRGCTPEEQAGDCAGGPICVAGPGYDGPTGLGSLDGIGALEPRLAFKTLPPAPARRGGSFAVEAVVEATGQAVTVDSTTPAVCTAGAGEITLLAAGTCTLIAAQPGYLEAQQSFAVGRTPQQVAFSSATPGDALEGGVAYQPVASASSGLPVAFVSLTPTICGVTGDAVLALAAGVCTIAAEQAGDAEYEPASPVTQTYTVAPAPAGGQPGGGGPGDAAPGAGVLSLRETATPFTDVPVPLLGSAHWLSRRDGTVRLSLAIRADGTLRWLTTFTRARRCPPHVSRCAGRIVRFAWGSRAIVAGTFTLSLHPSPAALRILRHQHALRVHTLVTLTTASGSIASLSTAMTARLAPPR
jgi:Subtilase family